MDLNKWAW